MASRAPSPLRLPSIRPPVLDRRSEAGPLLIEVHGTGTLVPRTSAVDPTPRPIPAWIVCLMQHRRHRAAPGSVILELTNPELQRERARRGRIYNSKPPRRTTKPQSPTQQRFSSPESRHRTAAVRSDYEQAKIQPRSGRKAPAPKVLVPMST